MGLLDHVVVVCLSFSGAAILCSIVAAPVTFLTTVHRDLFLHIDTDTCFLLTF